MLLSRFFIAVVFFSISSHAFAQKALGMLGASYITRAKATVNDKPDRGKFKYDGYHLQLSLYEEKEAQFIQFYAGPRLSLSKLTNRYQKTNPDNSAQTADEKLDIYEIGYGALANVPLPLAASLHFGLGIDFLGALIKQEGYVTKSQRYYGYGFNIGAGVGPEIGSSGFFVRAEAQVKAFLYGKDESDSSATVYNAEYNATVFLLGYMMVK